MLDGRKGVGEGGRNGGVVGDDVQSVGTGGVSLRERELGSGGCDTEVFGGVSP